MFRFTGKELDQETGLYYYGARYLDPKTSRWISADPAMGEYVPSPGQGAGKLGGMGGVYNTINLHCFAYAGNNPIKLTDPDGRQSVDGIDAIDRIDDDFIDQPPLQNAFNPLTQNSPELSNIEDMADYGCYFRSSQAVAEFEVGVALTAEQIQAAVTALQETPNPTKPWQMVLEGMLVHNPDEVINDAFSRLGHPELTGTVAWGARNHTEPDYIIQERSVPGANRHFILNDNSGNLLFDPLPGLTSINPNNRNVYVHGH